MQIKCKVLENIPFRFAELYKLESQLSPRSADGILFGIDGSITIFLRYVVVYECDQIGDSTLTFVVKNAISCYKDAQTRVESQPSEPAVFP